MYLKSIKVSRHSGQMYFDRDLNILLNHVSFLDGVSKLAGVNFRFLLTKWSFLLNCFRLILFLFGGCV